MHGSNEHYGHRLILSRYAGVPDGKPIPGLVEHGWNHDLGATLEDVLLPAPDPFFLWSARNLRACQEAGLGKHVVPLGAPFLYLPPPEAPIEGPARAESRPASTEAAPRSLLVVPIHGWEQEKLDHDFELYARKMEEIAGEFRSITVCLYWFEHQHAENRRPFESRGWEVVTAGKRDQNPRFLPDLRRLLLRHEYVCSNRVQTATFYALYLGRRFFIHGPPVGVERRLDRAGHLYDAWQRREYPMLCWEGFKDEAYVDLGAAELGLEFKRSPEALRELFLWEPDQAARLQELVAAFNARERRRRAGVRRERRRQALEDLPLIGRYLRRRS